MKLVKLVEIVSCLVFYNYNMDIKLTDTIFITWPANNNAIYFQNVIKVGESARKNKIWGRVNVKE